MLRTFRWSFVATVVGVALAWAYAGPGGAAVAAILTVLEVSLSFDNAVVNATVLERMNAFWQRIFLTVGIVIAVFGMRLLFPFVVVGVTARLTPGEALRLAVEAGDPETPGTYGFLLRQAHPAIASFGGMFLLMLFLSFVFEERELTWLTWVERPLARLGKLGDLPTLVSLVVLVVVASTLAASPETVLVAGVIGLATYLLTSGLGAVFEQGVEEEGTEGPGGGSAASALLATGRHALFLFLYLEVLDASFSFDGVIGAFAITSDPFIIAIGLGAGAMYVRSLTVYLVRRGTLADYVFLEHGAHWAIGALAGILLATIAVEVPEVVTGLVGIAFIGAGFASSVRRNRRQADAVV